MFSPLYVVVYSKKGTRITRTRNATLKSSLNAVSIRVNKRKTESIHTWCKLEPTNKIWLQRIISKKMYQTYIQIELRRTKRIPVQSIYQLFFTHNWNSCTEARLHSRGRAALHIRRASSGRPGTLPSKLYEGRGRTIRVHHAVLGQLR